MMFWKFQTQQAVPTIAPPAPPPPEFVPEPAPEPAAAPEPIAETTPAPEPAIAAPAPIAPFTVAVRPVVEEPALQPQAEYVQAAERTMRFLGEALQLPAWVLFKHANGALTALTGIGDYPRYTTRRELTIERLSDLPTVNLLGAAAPASSYAGVDRRQGNIDPALVAPYGVPLLDADGNVFGILCAFGDSAASERVAHFRPLIQYCVAMLGALVRIELTLEEATRRTERAQADALVDPLTGLHNRRAWDQLLATEDQRCNRHGYDAVIFVIDLDGLKAVNDRFGHEKGDELIKSAAHALERCVRRTDVVARVGGDEFSILAVKCDANAAARIREHIESTLQRANAPATVGFAVRSEAGDLFEAWRQADGAMYHRKRGNSRHGQRATDEQKVESAVAPAEADVTSAEAEVAPAVAAAAAEAVPQEPAAGAKPSAEAALPNLPDAPAPPERHPVKEPTVETSIVAQILERVLPALVSGIQQASPAAPPQQPAPEQTPPPEQAAPQQPAAAQAAPSEAPAPAAEPEAAHTVTEPTPVSQPSEDLIDIVSRLSRLSDNDRRLLDVFFKGSR